MRNSIAAALLFLCALIPASLGAQQSTSTTPAQAGPQTPQAASILQQAITAQTGGAPVTDVTMTGTITTTAGANTESGTITLIATAAGRTEATVSTSAGGARTEIRDISSGWPTLTIIGTDGVAHTVTTQSALAPHPASFYLPFVLGSGLSSPIYASSYVGLETWNGVPVQHVSVWMIPGGSWSASAQLLQQITQHDIYLDPSTLLPVAITFAVHPYDPTNPNRPLFPYRGKTLDSVEQVQFSQYQQVQGRSVALHVHTTMQAGQLNIVSDVQLSSVSFNTGATVAAN
jgi:hypothetical protein